MQPDRIEATLRRQKIWLQLQGTVIALGVFGFLSTNFLSSIAKLEPTSKVVNGDIQFSPADDGPYVITHVASYGEDSGDKLTAALPSPIAVTDSGGATIPMASLKWLDYRREPSNPPDSSATIVLLYQRVSKTKPWLP